MTIKEMYKESGELVSREELEQDMTVKDVLDTINCEYPETPINVYNSVGKNHTYFTFKDIAAGNIHPSYLDEPVNSFKQFGEGGVVSIRLK